MNQTGNPSSRIDNYPTIEMPYFEEGVLSELEVESRFTESLRHIASIIIGIIVSHFAIIAIEKAQERRS